MNHSDDINGDGDPIMVTDLSEFLAFDKEFLNDSLRNVDFKPRT